MNHRCLVWCWVVIVVSTHAGCQVLNTSRSSENPLGSSSSLQPSDYRNTTEEESDPWEFVGRDARGGRPREVDPDPWYRRMFMSAKARAIESNVGIE